MTCNCVRIAETNVSERLTEQLGVEAKAKAQGIALTITGGELGERCFMPFAIRADKPGYRSAKGKEMRIFFSYCPWCGVKVDGQDKSDSAGEPG